MKKCFELVFNSWSIRFSASDKRYMAGAHWYTKDFFSKAAEKRSENETEYRYKYFDTLEEAMAWCIEQEKL